MMLKNAVGIRWGPVPRAMLYAYNSIIMPSITYAATIWQHACQTHGWIEKFTKLNRLAMCAMMPMRKSTPTKGLEVILYMMPINMRVAEEAYRGYNRIRTKVHPKWDEIGDNGKLGHLKRCKKEIANLGIALENDDRDYFLNLDKKYNVDLTSKKSGLPICDSSIAVYTDGSRLQSRTGYGLLITSQDDILESHNAFLGEKASVFQAEVYAIHQACERTSKYDGNVTIFTDNQASVDALSQLKVRSSVVSNCIRALNTLGETREVVIKWIKSHSDFTGNEAADAEAKSGSRSNIMEAIPSPSNAFKTTLREKLEKRWNQQWKASETCRQTKIFFPVIDKAKSKRLVGLSRKELSEMVQIISGHNWLRKHESLIDPEVDPTCRLCREEEETSYHLIGECPTLWRLRRDVFHTDRLGLVPDWKPHQLGKMIKGSDFPRLDMDPEQPVQN